LDSARLHYRSGHHPAARNAEQDGDIRVTGEQERALPQLRRSRAERAASAVLPVSGAVYAAAEVMHLAGQPGGLDVAVGTTVAAALAYGVSARREKIPSWTAWAIAGCGGWMAAAADLGPVGHFPLSPLTWAWAGATAWAAYRARRHPSVIAAQDWRDARAGWLNDCRRWGLGGSHLLHHEFTRLGVRMIVDLSGTGERASAIARSNVPEDIAASRGIPRSRVTVSEHRIAGQIVLDIRDRDPWAHPIPHPACTADHEVSLDGSPSIMHPVPVGQDPSTGRVAAVALCDEIGGKNISVVAKKGSGKTVLLNCLAEGVTRARDALMIRINVSIKGGTEVNAWGPACHLTAFGPQQKKRALRVLRVMSGVIEWRSQEQARTGMRYVPSAADPLIVAIIDEIDAAMHEWAVRRELENIASKGRELGVSAVRAGQRGTAEWTGGANVRSQDDIVILGKVNRSTEAMHAAGEKGLRMPDMTSYGEGKPGVWAVAADDNSDQQKFRAWNLDDPADVRRIAAERAASQPDLPAACKAFLGDEYEQLLGSDVYARWAHGQTAATPPESVPATAQEQETQASPVAAATATVGTENLERLDFDMDDTTRAKFRALDEKLTRARAILAETEAMPPGPDVPMDKLRESSAERWRQVGEQAEIPTEAIGKLFELLREGTTMSKVAEAFGVKPWTARTWLEKLRGQGTVKITGERRTARWVLCEPEPPETASDGDGS
jgi:hypothetical protein